MNRFLETCAALAVLAAGSCGPPAAKNPPPLAPQRLPAVLEPQVELGVPEPPAAALDLLVPDAPVARRLYRSGKALAPGALRMRADGLIVEFQGYPSGRAVLELDLRTAADARGLVWINTWEKKANGMRIELPLRVPGGEGVVRLPLWERCAPFRIHYLTVVPDLAGGACEIRALRYLEVAEADLVRPRWIARGGISARGLFVGAGRTARFDLPARARRLAFCWSPCGAAPQTRLEITALGGPSWRREVRAPRSAGWSEATLDLPAGIAGLELRAASPSAGFFLGEARPLPAPRKSAADLIVITADTLRADHLGCYGSRKCATPHIDALARRGVLFERMYSVCNMTNPAHTSLFTGLYPKDHGIYNNRTQLSERATTLAEILRSAGYRTCCALGAKHLGPYFSNLGQGFDRVGASPDWVRRGEEVNRVLAAMVPWQSPDPLFIWAHFFDPHTPYRPPAPFDRKYYRGDPTRAGAEEVPAAFRPELSEPFEVRDAAFPRAQYRAEVEYLDQEVGRFLARCAQRERPAVILFVADHGESLGENGVYFNHGGLLPQNLRVACLLSAPAIRPGRRNTLALSTIDLLPTLCELLDLSLPVGARGASLLPVLAGQRAATPVFFEGAFGWALGRLRAERFEILHRREHRNANYRERVPAATPEIVDLQSPGLGQRRWPQALPPGARAALEAFAADRRPRGETVSSLTGAEIEGLRALGYLKDSDR